jgi:hypothetical protein
MLISQQETHSSPLPPREATTVVAGEGRHHKPYACRIFGSVIWKPSPCPHEEGEGISA